MKEIIRRMFFKPYRKGKGPTFHLTVWDLNKRDDMGKWMIGYLLVMTSHKWHRKKTVLFKGEDFHCSPLEGVDSDATIESLMHFLTLRSGDTDPEYFQDYTKEQKGFCDQHAEALSCCVENRFHPQGRE